MSQELSDISRYLKEISQSQKDQTRILKALNYNLLSLFSKTSDSVEPAPIEDEPVVVPPLRREPRVLTWSQAILLQRTEMLHALDIKIEQDESKWVWNGEFWERLEDPSGTNR